jgi:beta-glucosidase
MYTRRLIDGRSGNLRSQRYLHKNLPLIDMDFYLDEMSPDQLMHNLERLKDKPVYITENGCACNDDRFRIVYMALHYAAFRQAIDHGVDLRGLFYWSLMDNYEWGSYLPRFGLVDCDRKTFVRTPKPSAGFYRDIIAGNGFSGEVVRKYLQHLPSKTDPLNM